MRMTTFAIDVVVLVSMIVLPIITGLAWYLRDKWQDAFKAKWAKRCPQCGAPFKAPPTERTICPECREPYAKHI